MVPRLSNSPVLKLSKSLRHWYRQHQQTATSPVLPQDTVTVTRPIHPFCGLRLPVVHAERDQSGRRFVLVQHPRDGFLRLPVEWTDRAATVVPARIAGRDLQVDVRGLLRLAQACSAWASKSLDIPISVQTLGSQSREHIRPMDGPCRDTVVEPPRRAEADGNQSLGDASAQAIADQKLGGGE
jgi:hypothetical protein